MRKIIVLTLVLVGCVTAQPSTEMRVDDFTKMETPIAFGMELVRVDANTRQFMSLRPPPKPATGVNEIWLVSEGPGWRYLECHGLNILVDDEPLIDQTVGSHDGKILSGSNTREKVYTMLLDSHVKSMATAEETLIRICSEIYEVDAESKKNLTEYLKMKRRWDGAEDR